MAKGRKQEVFNINFNHDLKPQIEIMTVKQLFELLLVILLTIPLANFAAVNHNETVTSIVKYFDKLIRTEVKNGYIKEEKDNNIWSTAGSATANETVMKNGPLLSNFLLGLSGDSFGFFNDGYVSNFIDTVCRLVDPQYVSPTGMRDGILSAIATKTPYF